MESLKCVYDPVLNPSKHKGSKPIYAPTHPDVETSDPRIEAGVVGTYPVKGKRSVGACTNLVKLNMFVFKRIKRVLLTGIGPLVTENQLKECLDPAGPITECTIARSSLSGASLGHAYAIFKHTESCQRVCESPQDLVSRLRLLNGGDQGHITVEPDDHAGTKYNQASERADARINRQLEQQKNDVVYPIDTRELDDRLLHLWYSTFLGSSSNYVFFKYTVIEKTYNDLKNFLGKRQIPFVKLFANYRGFYIVFDRSTDAKQAFFNLHGQNILGKRCFLKLFVHGTRADPFAVGPQAKKILLNSVLSRLMPLFWTQYVKRNVKSCAVKVREDKVREDIIERRKLLSAKREQERAQERLREQAESMTMDVEKKPAGLAFNLQLDANNVKAELNGSMKRSKIRKLRPIADDTADNDTMDGDAIKQELYDDISSPRKLRKPNDSPPLEFHALPEIITSRDDPAEIPFGQILDNVQGSPDEHILESVFNKLVTESQDGIHHVERMVTQWPPVSQPKPFCVTPYLEIPFSSEWKRYLSVMRSKTMYEVVENYTGLPIGTKKSQPPVMSQKALAKSLGFPPRSKFTHDHEYYLTVDLNKLVKPTRLARSEIHDWGLYASEPIKENEFVIEYIGEIIKDDFADARERNYILRGIGSTYMFRLEDGGDVIDATVKGNLSRFMNHSCDPNCHAQFFKTDESTRIVFFSLRPIQLHEELTFNYNLTQASSEEDKIRCCCGAPTCTGWLT